jgi:hypothetical protein
VAQHAGGILRQHDACHYYLFCIIYHIILFYDLFTAYYLLIIKYLQRQHMHETSCSSRMSAIIIYSEDIYSLFIDHLLIIYRSFIYYLVPVAAACERRPAAAWCRPLLFIYLFVYLLWYIYYDIHCILFTCYLVPAAAACARHPAATRCWPSIFYLFIVYYLLCLVSASGSMRETSCGSRMPAIVIYFEYILYSSIIYLFIIYCSFIYYLVSTAAACGRRPAAAWCWPLLFIIYLLHLVLFLSFFLY